LKIVSGYLKMNVLKCEVVTVVKLNCDLHSYDIVWCWGMSPLFCHEDGGQYEYVTVKCWLLPMELHNSIVFHIV